MSLKETMDMTRLIGAVLIVSSALAGCGGNNPYLNMSLSEMEGKDKAWVEKNYGEPTGKAARFFGGETWTYVRVSGGKQGPPFGNFTPIQCQITIKFDREGKVASTDSSGC